MKSKKIMDSAEDRHTYRIAQMFNFDIWSTREMNRNRRKCYGGSEKVLRRPNWKLQKIKKQWMVKPWKTKTWVSTWRNTTWVNIEV